MPKYRVSAPFTAWVEFIIEAEDEDALTETLDQVSIDVLVGNGSDSGLIGLDGVDETDSVNFITDGVSLTDPEIEVMG